MNAPELKKAIIFFTFIMIKSTFSAYSSSKSLGVVYSHIGRRDNDGMTS